MVLKGCLADYRRTIYDNIEKYHKRDTDFLITDSKKVYNDMKARLRYTENAYRRVTKRKDMTASQFEADWELRLADLDALGLKPDSKHAAASDIPRSSGGTSNFFSTS